MQAGEGDPSEGRLPPTLAGAAPGRDAGGTMGVAVLGAKPKPFGFSAWASWVMISHLKSDADYMEEGVPCWLRAMPA